MAETLRIAVVGGGVNGIGTAYALLKAFPQVRLTIYSHLFSPDTTSDGAGGMWGPEACPGTSEENMIKWSKATWDTFHSWFLEKKEWISLCRVQCVSRKEIATPFWSGIPLNYKKMNQQEIKHFGPEYIDGCSYSTYVAEPSIFLPKFMEEIRSRGGTLENRKVGRLQDLSEEADIIVNCSGLGAYDLVPDKNVFPIRGQVIRLKAPWVKDSYADESEETHCYVIPNTNSLVLGGTFQEHDWRTTVDAEDSRTIWENCTNLVPQLKGGEIISEWVGLRPARKNGIRLEQEEICFNSKKIPVFHNYGHGGSGVTTFVGCSQDVETLVGNYIHRHFHPVCKY